jgi:hypothetical protein
MKHIRIIFDKMLKVPFFNMENVIAITQFADLSLSHFSKKYSRNLAVIICCIKHIQESCSNSSSYQSFPDSVDELEHLPLPEQSLLH